MNRMNASSRLHSAWICTVAVTDVEKQDLLAVACDR